jgi:nucleoside-specific outer membrane channel protein Tsx
VIPSIARLAVAAVLAGALAPEARADFATTNIQGLEGWSFRDPTAGGNDAKGGRMSTITLNHFSTWAYGDNFAFVDMLRGEFADGTEAHVYTEWHPRLFLNRLLGAKGPVLGIFRDAGLAGEINVGQGFYAYLAGLGADFALPFPGTVALNVYYRYASIQIPGPDVRDHTWQVSPSWVIPFRTGKVRWLFTGFVDVNGVHGTSGKPNSGVEVMAQPELLVDVLALAGGLENKLFVGTEWYLHHHPLNVPDKLVSAPQALVQWNLH